MNQQQMVACACGAKDLSISSQHCWRCGTDLKKRTPSKDERRPTEREVKHIEFDVFKTDDHAPLPHIEGCPHCGSDRISPASQPDTVDGGLICFGECDRCGAQGPPADSIEQALELWNQRVPLIQKP